MFPSSLFVLSLTVTLVAAGPATSTHPEILLASPPTAPLVFNAYSGSLYRIKRASDNATSNGSPVSAGASTTCAITTIFDQSGRGNHLTRAPPWQRRSKWSDNLAPARGAPVMLNGKKAYGVFIAPGTGYRNDATNGIAVGDAAEGMYAVFDGTHFNRDCCFDYGNAESSATDTGNVHMEAHLLWHGGNRTANPSHPSMTSRFVPAVVKDRPGHWAIRGGNAVSGQLGTFYSGVRPSGGYNPMKKEGAIILGTGGDNSDRGRGTFYEGVITSGYPSDATENKVQANIVAARYTTSS
ncbi:alpha-L-arabinofuranosidase [Mycena leptocephala]|nr:alpha-L-arabinofuranosidase [Mycena leptocephala]